MTIAFLPDPLEDELLFGWLARHRRYLGMPGAAKHTEMLFGTRFAVVSPCLQGRIADLCTRLPFGAGAADRMLRRHSLFPYYTAFQEPAIIEIARADLVEQGGAKAFMMLGLAAFCIPSRRTALDVCPECHWIQVSALGVPTWLRSHQLPGSLVCAVHGVPLEAMPLRGRGRHEFRTPTVDAPAETDPAWDIRQGNILMEIARREASLLDFSGHWRQLDEWLPYYRDLLASRGLMRSASKVDHPALRDAVTSALGDVLPLLPLPCRNIEEGGWPSLLVRKHRKAMHPLFHVLMDIVVDRTPAPTRLARLASSPPRRKTRTRLRRPGRKTAARRDWSAIDAEACVRVRHACGHLLRTSPPVRVTFSLIEQEAFSPGWLQKRSGLVSRSYALAKAMAETETAFLDRRLAYWNDRLPSAPDWEVCRVAGIRHRRWPEARGRLRHLRSSKSAAA